MNDEELRAFLNLLMVSDPWPLGKKQKAILDGYADYASKSRGYKDWIEAYHFFKPFWKRFKKEAS